MTSVIHFFSVNKFEHLLYVKHCWALVITLVNQTHGSHQRSRSDSLLVIAGGFNKPLPKMSDECQEYKQTYHSNFYYMTFFIFKIFPHCICFLFIFSFVNFFKWQEAQKQTGFSLNRSLRMSVVLQPCQKGRRGLGSAAE